MLPLVAAALAAFSPRCNPVAASKSRAHTRMSLPSGSNVLLVGGGPVVLLAAKLAALRGYQTTCAVAEGDVELAPRVVFDGQTPDGSLPLSFLKIAGPDADLGAIQEAAANADGLIIAFDDERLMNPGALDVFMPADVTKPRLKHVAMMSRYLNGNGMGFFASAAKVAANAEIWAGSAKSIEAHRDAEKMVTTRAEACGVAHTMIRAGTLKGGASGDALAGGAGEPTFLNPTFYSLGQQDVVNWRLLYDCAALGVNLVAGDTLPGPGFTAALTATSPEGGDGDSHRGAVATALIEALGTDTAANKDFSVGAVSGREFPSSEEWAGMFASA